MSVLFLDHLKSNVFLAVPSEEHLDLLLQWINNPETRQFLAAYGPMTHTGEKAWLANLSNNSSVRKVESAAFIIVEKESKKPIGTVGLHGVDWKNRHATSGISVGEDDFRGKGFGTHSEMLLLSWVFLELGLNKVVAHVLAFNERSRKSHEKCGFTQVGRLKRHHFKQGKWYDELLLEVHADQWHKVWKKFQDGTFDVKQERSSLDWNTHPTA